jgi:uncharacterized protein with HEPN domain
VAATIERFGRKYETFLEDNDYYNSVLTELIQIGELAHALSESFVEETRACIPWHEIVAARNAVVHDYLNIVESLVWHTITVDVPQLQAFCEARLESFGYLLPAGDDSA